MQTAVTTTAPLASLVPTATVNNAFIRRSRSLRYEEANYDLTTAFHRRISKLIVDADGREQTWYMVNFWSADPANPGVMENYRELSDANLAYQRLA